MARVAQPALTGRQKRFLRSRAQQLDPVVWVGDEGLSDGVIRALDDALLAHELVKVRMRAPDDKKALASQLATATGAALAGVIGHTAILYRAHPEEPVLPLP
jgi:RNA-binding protein